MMKKNAVVFILLFLLFLLNYHAAAAVEFQVIVSEGISGYQSNPLTVIAPEKGTVRLEIRDENTLYRTLEKELNLEGKIAWHTDFIPDEKVRFYFSAADLIVQPYKSATQSGVTQIAYHFEKPMLVTNVGGLAEIVPDGKVGYVCDVNEDDVADALRRFAAIEPKKRENLFRKNIQQEKQKYAWSQMTQKIYDHTK